MAQIVAQHLFEYVERHGGEVRMAAPPSQHGTQAHSYRWSCEPSYAELIKGWEDAKGKPGVHAFVRSFPSLFAATGKHPNQKLLSKGPAGQANKVKSVKKSKANKGEQNGHGGDVGELKVLQSLQVDPNTIRTNLNVSAQVRPAACIRTRTSHLFDLCCACFCYCIQEFTPGAWYTPPPEKTSPGGTIIVGAQTAAAPAPPAAASEQKVGRPFEGGDGGGRTREQVRSLGQQEWFVSSEVKEQLRDLKQDIYIAMMALKAAQEKMHFLDKTINGSEFSAA